MTRPVWQAILQVTVVRIIFCGDMNYRKIQRTVSVWRWLDIRACTLCLLHRRSNQVFDVWQRLILALGHGRSFTKQADKPRQEAEFVWRIMNLVWGSTNLFGCSGGWHRPTHYLIIFMFLDFFEMKLGTLYITNEEFQKISKFSSYSIMFKFIY